MENFLRNEDSEYGEGILLDEYEGKLSLVAAQEGQGGEIWKRWVAPIGKGKKPVEKRGGGLLMLPWKIELGDPRTAIDKLKTLIAMIEAETGRVADTESDIPF